MNEACLNLLGPEYDLTTQEGQYFAIRTIIYMRDIIKDICKKPVIITISVTLQKELVIIPKGQRKYPDIITAGEDVPYYAIHQLPVGYTDDISECLIYRMNYSLFIRRNCPSPVSGKKSKMEAQETDTKVSQITGCHIFTDSTFSICNDHGYILSEHFRVKLRKCNEVWSRVVGHLDRFKTITKGKEEYRQRIKYVIKDDDKQQIRQLVSKGLII